jgi:1-acyl-sn-glycerol-3-phosphate acyltransferase
MPKTSSAHAETPGAMKEQVYEDTRPAAYFTRFHQRARTKEPDFGIYGLIHLLMYCLGVPLYRIRAVGVENVPDYGPVILAPNHFSFADHFLMAVWLHRKVRFVAKSQMFKPPMQFIYTHGGVIPVQRGQRDEAMFTSANAVLDRAETYGGLLAMYCEGGRSRSGKITDQAKPGIGRLAAESGARVVPVAIIGSNSLRNWSRPWKMRLPKITVVFGAPLACSQEDYPPRERQQALADDILSEIRWLHDTTERPSGWIRNWLTQGVSMVSYKLHQRLERT